MTVQLRSTARLDPIAFIGSLATTALRLGAGIATRPRTSRPDTLFELYEFEGCPYCRIVREALTELDLDAMIFPCPKGGTRFRPELVNKAGKAQFPFLRDPATGASMYESADIVAYLFETYGGGTVPLRWQASGLQQLGSTLAGMWRMGAGRRARPSIAPAQPLELYSFEGSPFARLVRETLCELELPYVLRSVGRSAASDWLPPGVRDVLGIRSIPQTLNRHILLERAGRITVPYLVDANCGGYCELRKYMTMLPAMLQSGSSQTGCLTSCICVIHSRWASPPRSSNICKAATVRDGRLRSKATPR